MDLVALAGQAHGALHTVSVGGAGGMLVAASAAWLVTLRQRLVPGVLRALIEVLIVAVPGVVALSAAAGLVLLAGTGGPRDGLHAVYGVVALVALPLTRILGAGPPPHDDDPRGRPAEPASTQLTRGPALWLVAGAAITLGALLRLAGTG
jgi:hypothetical protein